MCNAFFLVFCPLIGNYTFLSIMILFLTKSRLRLYHLLMVSVLLFIGNGVMAQDVKLMYEPDFNQAKAYVSINATIVKSYEAALGTDLKFGDVIPDSKPKKVKITPYGRRKVLIGGNVKSIKYQDIVDANTKTVLNNSAGGPKPMLLVNEPNNKKQSASDMITVNSRGYSPARYYVSGGDISCKIILPDKPVVLSNVSQGARVIVSDWDARLFKDNGGASQSLIMGATLSVGSKEQTPPGVYEGSYNITFLYN